MPITPLSGVRISWLMLARNALLATLAASAAARADSAAAWAASALAVASASSAVRSATRASRVRAYFSSSSRDSRTLPCMALKASAREASSSLPWACTGSSSSPEATRLAPRSSAPMARVSRRVTHHTAKMANGAVARNARRATRMALAS